MIKRDTGSLDYGSYKSVLMRGLRTTSVIDGFQLLEAMAGSCEEQTSLQGHCIPTQEEVLHKSPFDASRPCVFGPCRHGRGVHSFLVFKHLVP